MPAFKTNTCQHTEFTAVLSYRLEEIDGIIVQNNPINANDPMGLYDVTAQFGFHLPIAPGTAVGPLWSWTANDYSNNPNFNFTKNPVQGEVVFGGIADVGASLGISNISGINNNAGYQLNIGAGKYGGLQITFADTNNQAHSYFNPARYIDGVSLGLGIAVPLSPVTISRAEDASKLNLSGNSSAAASGGFVLYPNKSNTNQMQSVYKK